jgi:hypothetical protein
MRAVDLETFERWVGGTPLVKDRLWRRPVEDITPLEVQLLYARAGLVGMRSQAIEAIDRLQTALLIAVAQGRVSRQTLRIITHEPPSNPYMIDEFLDCLVKLRPARRAAVLFALDAQFAPARVVELTWHEAKSIAQVKSQAREILQVQARNRHLRLPYVFWEWVSDKVAAPLLHLERDAQKAFSCDWPALQVRFTNMVWISARSDAVSFLDLAEEAASGRL